MKEMFEPVRMLLRQGRTKEAREALDRLRDSEMVPPDEAWRLHELYGAVFHDMADAEGVAAAYFNAVQVDRYLRAQREHYSSYLFALHYLPNIPAGELAQQMLSYQRLYRDETLLPARKMVQHDRLRIGFLASDFLESSSARFYEPLMTGLDPHGFEIYAYALNDSEDDFTRQLRASGLTWRSLHGLSIRQGADAIRRDEIDILMDLGGHAAGGLTLMLMALRPAMVQLCGIGWFDTTGLAAVDAFLTDAVMDPPAEDGQGRFVEQLLRLPAGFCFQPTEPMTAIGRQPRRQGSPVTFGSFQNFMKISQPVMECWRQILNAAPETRLIVQDTTPLPERCRKMKKRLDYAGLPMARVEVRPGSDHYLADYQQIDILLDTFPYTGGAAVATALYMGVPVVALRGDHHSARLNASLLTAAGCTQWLAETVETYCRTALQLAAAPVRLGEVQLQLRAVVEQSRLMDRRQYCASFQQACLNLWQKKGDYTL